MAIGQLGMFIQAARQLCKDGEDAKNPIVKTKDYLKTGTAHALDVADVLLSVTLIVLGILAYMNYLPLPEGWGVAFAFAIGAAGIMNLLASYFKAYQSMKTEIADWKKTSKTDERDNTREKVT